MNNLQSVSKAITGALVTALVAYLAKHNVILGEEIAGALNVLIAGALGFLTVYISPPNKSKGE